MGKRGQDVHYTVRRIDASMATMNRMLSRFGVPTGANQSLTGLKKSVGDVVAKLEMIERRH